MKLPARIITSLCIGYIFYCTLNLVWGSTGFFSMGKLQTMKVDLKKNIEAIEKNYEKLSKELSALRSSSEKIIVEARNIGYYKENEGIIVVKGYEGRKNFYTLGKLVKIDYKEDTKKPFFRAISFGAVLSSLIVVFLCTKRANGTTQRKYGGKRENT